MNRDETLSAIASDLERCDIALSILKGPARKRFADHKRECRKAIRDLVPVSPEVEAMTDDELLAALAE